MSRLPITIATWDYDRVRALADGRVRVEGCDVNYLTMPVEECFERAFFHGEFDVAEIGFSPYLIALSRGICPYVAVPAFLSRMFRHSVVYIRTDRGIEGPADLRGKRIGVPEYQMSAVMWFRGYLQDEFGIAAKDINWVQAGLENPGRRDKFPLNLPDDFPLVSRNDATLTGCSPTASSTPSCRPAARRVSSTAIRRSGGLFPDYRAAEREYYRKSGLFPDHARGRSKARASGQHRWLAASLYKAFLAGQAARRRRICRDDRAQDRATLAQRPSTRRPKRSWGRISGPMAWRKTARRFPPWRAILMSKGLRCGCRQSKRCSPKAI